MKRIENEISKGPSQLIKKIINFLETGEHVPFETQYIKSIAKIVELSDSNEGKKFLYAYYKKEILDYTKYTVKPRLFSQKGHDFLKSFIKSWSNHKHLVLYMQQIFYYIDRTYLSLSNLPNLFTAGCTIYRETLFDYIKEELEKTIFENLIEQKDDNDLDPLIIRQALSSYGEILAKKFALSKNNSNGTIAAIYHQSMDVARQEFQNKIFMMLVKHYNQKAEKWINVMIRSQYLSNVVNILGNVEKRIQIFVCLRPKDVIIKTVIDEFVVKYCAKLYNIDEAFRSDRIGDLEKIVAVFSYYYPYLQEITIKFMQYIEYKALPIFSDPSLRHNPQSLINSLLSLKLQADKMTEKFFKNHPAFVQSLNKTFQKIMSNFDSISELLAQYLNNEMLKGVKFLTHEECDLKLSNIVNLISCLYDIDKFLLSYEKYLSKRLLVETNINKFAEEMMISKLKGKLGHSSLRKISDLYEDVMVSKIIIEEYNSNCSVGDIPFEITLLRKDHSFSANNQICPIPFELEKLFENFKGFYKSRFPYRKLEIDPFYGKCEISTLFTNKNYTCIVTPCQAFILIMLNNKQSINISDIQFEMGLSTKRILGFLLPFFNPKRKLLNKKHPGKIIKDDEEISVNLEFCSSSIRNEFVPKKIDMFEDVGDKENKDIENDRKLLLDSIIVKIAKKEKIIGVEELVGQVLSEVKLFVPQPESIKKHIESLVNREFLEINPHEIGMYNYIP